jgi:hypothetical protein
VLIMGNTSLNAQPQVPTLWRRWNGPVGLLEVMGSRKTVTHDVEEPAARDGGATATARDGSRRRFDSAMNIATPLNPHDQRRE